MRTSQGHSSGASLFNEGEPDGGIRSHSSNILILHESHCGFGEKSPEALAM